MSTARDTCIPGHEAMRRIQNPPNRQPPAERAPARDGRPSAREWISTLKEIAALA